MKMKLGIHVEMAAVITSVHVNSGGQIDPKNLLVEFE
jgi:pyruvate carboxylase